ncbi:MAG: motility associated factor glycosyltransferase family protein, partial [Spirochaetota bacterium]
MSSNKHRIHAQNLEALDAAHPGVAATVSASDPPADAEYAQDPATGIVSLKASGAYVHSARNPIREAGRLIEDLKRTSGLRVAVFFGFGLGYHVEAELDQCPDLHCVVYEADPSLLNESLRWRDLRHVLGHERLSLFTACPPENVAMLLRNMHRSQVYAVRLRSLYTRDASAYEKLDKVIDDTFRRRDVNRATLKRFGRRWIVNLVANLSVMARARRVSELESFFRGVPAFVLAGGPSLDAIVPFLDRIAERCVLIAVDTSLVAALRRGIDPDYTIIVDPQYWNSRHLDLCRNSRTILVSESSTHPRVFKLLGTRTYMCSSLFPLGQYLEQPLGAFGSLGAGGSVSTTAWDFARHIGAENIYCAGLDLGFPGRNTHFRGSFFEERSLTWCDRMHPTETMAWRYLNSGTPFYTQDFTGGRVMTDERMRVYH